MVTVELAFASLLGAAVLVIAIGVVVSGFRLAQCQVTANEVARQMARGDAQAVAAASADRPEGSLVTTATDDGVSTASVTCDAAVGPLRVPLEAHAEVVTEA